MPNYTTTGVENVVREWCERITNVPFYFLDESVTRPSGLYGMIKLMVADSLGTPSENFTDEEVKGEPWSRHEVADKRHVTFSINTYRSGARNTLNNLLAGYWLDLPYEILQNANIGIITMGQPRDLTETVEGQREERAQMDITFEVCGSATELLNTIETVPISGTEQQ